MKIFQHSAKDYINKILSGVATGIVVGLIPNAILGEVFKMLYEATSVGFFHQAWQVVYAIQFTVPLLVGALVGLQFGFNGIQTACVAGATFIGSGVVKLSEAGTWSIAGTGDLFNVMFTAFFAVVIIDLVKSKLGSLTVVLLPIIGAGIAGYLGLVILPYVSGVTATLGSLINGFTTMQKYLMAILIAMSFSVIIITPISTVAIGLAIGLDGIAAGSAAIGVGACAIVLGYNSIKAKNPGGVTLAVLLGAMKMMIPNFFKKPIMALPIMLTACVSGFFAAFVNIGGTAASAGFGIVGLVGPLAAFKGTPEIQVMGNSAIVQILLIFVAFFVIPVVMAWISDILFRKVLKLYDYSIFENGGNM